MIRPMGKLREIGHATISLRGQLRFTYENSAWLRYVLLGTLALLGLLLLLLPGVPPRVFTLLWQDLPLSGHLLALHGLAALLSLLALLAQALTWLVLWVLYVQVTRATIRSTWRLYHTQRVLSDGWWPSTAAIVEAENRHEKSKLPTHILDQSRLPTHILAPSETANPPSLAPAAQPAYGASVGRTPPMPERTSQARPVQPARAQNIASASYALPAQSMGGTPSAVLARSLSENAAFSSQPRQFVRPSPSLEQSRPHSAPYAGDPTTSASHANWPALSLPGVTGVAWDVGITRKDRPNEDSVLTLRGTCNLAHRLLPFELHIVADGMGGHAHGRLASRMAIKGLLETIIPGLVAYQSLESDKIVDLLIDGVHWANQLIYQYGRERGAEMGTTLTAALLLDEIAYIINVGDSRTYVYRPGVGLTQVTRDHSLVARLVENGSITPDEVYTHPERNKIYRGLGDKTEVTVDWFILPVQSGDLLLLCSDGLWEMVRDPQITEILAAYAQAPMMASNTLLRAALQSGGKDNVSLLVARVQT